MVLDSIGVTEEKSWGCGGLVFASKKRKMTTSGLSARFLPRCDKSRVDTMGAIDHHSKEHVCNVITTAIKEWMDLSARPALLHDPTCLAVVDFACEKAEKSLKEQQDDEELGCASKMSKWLCKNEEKFYFSDDNCSVRHWLKRAADCHLIKHLCIRKCNDEKKADGKSNAATRPNITEINVSLCRSVLSKSPPAKQTW